MKVAPSMPARPRHHKHLNTLKVNGGTMISLHSFAMDE